MIEADTWLPVSAVAEQLSVSKMTVYRLLDADELAHIRVGRSIRVSQRSLSRFIAQGGSDAADWHYVLRLIPGGGA